MANENPYTKTVKTYDAEEIAGWEVLTLPDEASVTKELRGRTFLVSPVQTGGGEQHHHELEIDIDGPVDGKMQVHLGHAQNSTLFDRVKSTYYYTIDFKSMSTGVNTKTFNAQYGGRKASWWLVEVKEGFTVKSLTHKYFESRGTSWLHGPVNKQVDFPGGGRMRYSVALPPNYDPDEARKYPVMISVGGSGELGDDGRILTQTDPGCICCKNAAVYTQFPTIHVTCQVPITGFNYDDFPSFRSEYPYHDGWRRTYRGDGPGGVGIRMVVETILNEMSADPDRVYMTGFSGGGIMSFEMLKYGRDIFAAVVPVGGWPIGGAYANVFAHPYWDEVPPGQVNSMRDRLMKEIHQARHISTICAAGSSDGMRWGTEAYNEVGIEEFGIDSLFKLYNTGHGGSPKKTWDDTTTMAWVYSKTRSKNIPEDRYADGDYDKPIELRSYPMMRLTADNQGYYRVFVNDEHVSNHVQEREASERAYNEKTRDPTADVYYDHDYRVDVTYTPPEVSPCGECPCDRETPSESASDSASDS